MGQIDTLHDQPQTEGQLRGQARKKDRGKEPKRQRTEYPWFWGWDEETTDFAGLGKEPDGNRWNDCHYTNAFKQKARGVSKAR